MKIFIYASSRKKAKQTKKRAPLRQTKKKRKSTPKLRVI